jgi:DNA modification methylase
MNTKDQLITDRYAIYNSDCMEVLPTLPDESVDLSIYSPPFAGLYNYSSSERDFSNCDSKDQFLQMYDFLIREMARVTKRGRLNCVHVTEVVENNGSSWDFPNEVIKLHESHGFQYKGRITIWKEPLKVRMRTMVKSLMHKLIVEDASQCFPAQPDYLLLFKKKGESKVPVTHPVGIEEYFGEVPILPNILQAWNNANNSKLTDEQLWDHLNKINESDKVTKLNHYVWQRYASSVWDDIRIDNVLPFRDSKEEDDEKHVHPLQLDVIDRCVSLWSNPGEVVLTPFMGVGSEVYSPVSQGRKAIGIELKDSYYKQAILNLKEVDKRFQKTKTITLLDEITE